MGIWDRKMKMTVIGGGNIGTFIAAEMACKGHEVTIYSSKPDQWEKKITVFDERKTVLMTGELTNVTADLKEAVKEADLIWITVPAELFSKLGKQLAQYIAAGQIVGVVPGSGGAEFAFSELIQKGALLFGLQRVHSIARLEQYGCSVHMLGRKAKLELGAIPAERAVEFSRLVSDCFDMPCEALPNYLCVTLTPSNPILHTTRLYVMFQEYMQGMIYPRNYLFYEEWTEQSSKMLIACDAELQHLCDVMPFDLRQVVSLTKYYESDTAELMTEKIRGIKAFRGILSPMIRCKGGWMPDFSSRYFTSDFPYGLKIVKDLAFTFEVAVPNIDKVWRWYERVDPEHAGNAFEQHLKIEDLMKLYL